MKQNENVPAQNSNSAIAINVDLSFTAMNKALGAVFTETMKFKQALKVFDGMASFQVSVSKDKTMRFDEILKQVNVFYKAGHIDPESVKAIWKVKTADGYMALYRPVPGREAVEGDEKPRPVRVWNEDKKTYESVSVWKVVAVEKWNAKLILTGILQTAFTDKFIKLADESQKAWDAYEGEIYCFDKVQDKDGITNKRHIIRKSQVEF